MYISALHSYSLNKTTVYRGGFLEVYIFLNLTKNSIYFYNKLIYGGDSLVHQDYHH